MKRRRNNNYMWYRHL